MGQKEPHGPRRRPSKPCPTGPAARPAGREEKNLGGKVGDRSITTSWSICRRSGGLEGPGPAAGRGQRGRWWRPGSSQCDQLVMRGEGTGDQLVTARAGQDRPGLGRGKDRVGPVGRLAAGRWEEGRWPAGEGDQLARKGRRSTGGTRRMWDGRPVGHLAGRWTCGFGGCVTAGRSTVQGGGRATSWSPPRPRDQWGPSTTGRWTWGREGEGRTAGAGRDGRPVGRAVPRGPTPITQRGRVWGRGEDPRPAGGSEGRATSWSRAQDRRPLDWGKAFGGGPPVGEDGRGRPVGSQTGGAGTLSTRETRTAPPEGGPAGGQVGRPNKFAPSRKAPTLDGGRKKKGNRKRKRKVADRPVRVNKNDLESHRPSDLRPVGHLPTVPPTLLGDHDGRPTLQRTPQRSGRPGTVPQLDRRPAGGRRRGSWTGTDRDGRPVERDGDDDNDQVPSHAELEIWRPPASGPQSGFLCSTAIQKVPLWDDEFGTEHFPTKSTST